VGKTPLEAEAATDLTHPKRTAWLLLALLLAASSARAQGLSDPGSRRLPRDRWIIDLLPRVTDHPDVLSAHEALIRQRYLDFGVDPMGKSETVSTATLLRRWLADNAGQVLFEKPRQVEILEAMDGIAEAVFYRYPESFLFYAPLDTNLVGVAFEPPRPVDDPQVEVRIVTRSGLLRGAIAVALNDQWRSTLSRRAAAARSKEGLLNFTVPIKLPRTLERLIGKGEATSIRISGQEKISIGGTSTIRDNFLGNEIQQRQSLFPTLEMKQSLRVNLDGQVGEKIKVRVTHDSEAFGNDATQVKLSFEGDEDDIIQTIRAGNIDVTLPSSRLLGIQAQRGGLFGVKVEGALGPLDFTLLTSKEQSQQGKRSFSAAGGTTQEFEISSTDYVKNRIFRLTAPQAMFFTAGDTIGGAVVPFSLQDQSAGWDPQWRIDVSSLDLYVSVPSGQVAALDKGDVLDVFPGRAYMERTGYYWGWTGGTPDPNADPVFGDEAFVQAPTWRRLAVTEWRPLIDADKGTLIGILLTNELQQNIALGVTYDVVDASGTLVMRVGRPWFGGAFDPIPNPDGPKPGEEQIYYFKLIKAVSQSAPDPGNPLGLYGQGFDLAWEYMFRNFYFLRGVGIDPTTLKVEIRTNNNNPLNEFEVAPPESRRRWLNIFGLDTKDSQGNPVEGGDGLIDLDANVVFPDLGLLQFPSPTPFDESYLSGRADQGGNDGVPAPDLYRKALTSIAESQNHFFNIFVSHASTSSRLSLGAFNIKEGSEEVRLDGRTLTRGVDYDIDYFSGEITLTGAASQLNAQTNISVDFEVDPLFGGGRTSLNGLNLGYHLGRNKTISSTWLLQSKPSNNRKPRLGEEPTKDWVGNLTAKLQFEPQFLTSLANLLPMVNSTEPSRLNLDAEVAVSIPNPNTNGNAYLDDFESVDRSDVIPMGREGWWWASLPAEYDSPTAVDRKFEPDDRAYVRWYRPSPSVTREDLNPALSEQERRDIVPALHLQMEADASGGAWGDSLYTGIMRGFPSDLDLTEAQFLEFWVNDFQPNEADRQGVLHFDFGFINEDFYWKWVFDQDQQRFVLQQFELDQEDQDNDGTLQTQEDVGLDGVANELEDSPHPPFQNVPSRSSDPGGDDFDSTRESDASPFPRINGLERNQRLDTEDINRSGFMDMVDGYFTMTLPLDDQEHIIVDINKEFPDYIPADDRKKNNAWRKYRIDLREVAVRIAHLGEFGYTADSPDLSRIRFLRIWYEIPGGSPVGRHDLEFAEMRFLGNRWISDGIHDADTHDRLDPVEAAPADFKVGVLNNKDNPDYIPPVFPDTRNNVAEKEQSLQLAYTNLGPGQEIRVRKDVPGTKGQDFSQYGELNFFWRAPLSVTQPVQLDPTQQHLVPFFWVGTDSLNYYEISFRFDEVGVDPNTGWQQVRVLTDEMTNAKVDDSISQEVVLPGGETIRVGTVTDIENGSVYRLVIRGRPDLRRVRRYYAGVRYEKQTDGTGTPAGPLLTGDVLFNELRLRKVNRALGFAKQLSLSTAIPGLGDISGSFSETDAEYRGLNRDVGSGSTDRNLQVRASTKLQNLVPTFGFDLPFSINATRRASKPKFFPDDDVRLLDASLQDSLSTEESSESFNFQVRKRSASRNKILAYTLDRLAYSYSVTRSRLASPRRNNRRYTDKSQYNYDLNFGAGSIVRIPLLGYKFRILPTQVTVSSTWTKDNNETTNKFEDGSFQQTATFTKKVTNNSTISFSPFRNMRFSFSVSSVRDPNRNHLITDDSGRVIDEERVKWLGFIWGMENNHNERLSLNYTPLLPVVRWFKPDIQFTGSYGENRNIAVRRTQKVQETDPVTGQPVNVTLYLDGEKVRHLNGTNDLTLRSEIDLGGFFKKVLGTGRKPPARRQPQATARRQVSRVQRRRSPTLPQPKPPPAPADTTGTSGTKPPAGGGSPPGKGGAGGTQEGGGSTTGTGGQGSGGASGTGPDANWPTPSQAAPPATAGSGLPEGESSSTGGKDTGEGKAAGEKGADKAQFHPKAALAGLLRPVASLLREIQPVRVSYNLQNNTSYQHAADRAVWLYRLAFVNDPGVGGAGSKFDANGDPVDDNYSSFRKTRKNRLNLSTQTRLSRNIRLDLTYTRNWGENSSNLQSTARDLSLEWPVLTLNFQNVQNWKIFGNLFSMSTIDFTYRNTSSIRGQTATNEGTPRRTRSIQPRWNVRFKNDLSANLNVNFTEDRAQSAGKDNVTNRISVNMQFSKSFDAHGALGFLRFGKAGTGSTIDATLDLSFDQRKSARRLENNREDQVTGNRTITIRPRFNYQFSRALNAGMDLSYSRNKDLGNTQNGSTSFGIGFNATFTF